MWCLLYYRSDTFFRDRLASLGQDVSAFSKIVYLGVKRGELRSNDDEESKMFDKLRRLIERETKDTAVRSPRSLGLIFKTLQVGSIDLSSGDWSTAGQDP